MTKKLIEKDEVLKVCQIPGSLLPLISDSGFNSQLEFNHRRGIKVANFINQFMNIEQFEGKRILELGPGHYSFSLIARSLGAEVVCVERNEGFIRLGKELGFEVANLDFGLDMGALRDLGKFDGLWAKGVYNAYNYSQQEVSSFFETINSVLSNQAWGLFVTVNKGDDQDRLIAAINYQKQEFLDWGWRNCGWDEEFARRFAMFYTGGSQFTRGISIG